MSRVAIYRGGDFFTEFGEAVFEIEGVGFGNAYLIRIFKNERKIATFTGPLFSAMWVEEEKKDNKNGQIL